MDYKKKYEEVLEKAKQWHKDGYGHGCQEVMEDLFPELTESEGERIRKELIVFLEYYRLNNVLDSKTISLLTDSVAWLEKQVEQKQELLIKEKVLKNSPFVEQKPAEWSEEDEKMLQVAINACNSYQNSLVRNDSRFDKAVKAEEWLKSLRPNHWKPSGEQMEALKFCIEHNIDNEGIFGSKVVKLFNELKKL